MQEVLRDCFMKKKTKIKRSIQNISTEYYYYYYYHYYYITLINTPQNLGQLSYFRVYHLSLELPF